MLKIVPLVIVLLAAPAPAPGATDTAAEAMAALPDLVGEWSGGGWVRQGPGEPQRFVGEERVEERLDGRILLIEGRHWTPDREQVVHHALALLSWDGEAGTYRFASHLADGRGGSFVGHMEGDTFVWEIPSPSGTIRYAIEVAGDTWHEVGSIEHEGRQVPIFEMTLKRQR